MNNINNVSNYLRIKYAIDNFAPQSVQEGDSKDLLNAIKLYYNKPNVFIHYAKLPTLGINESYSYNTPAGLYGYLFNDSLIKNPASFAKDRQYIHIFRVSSGKEFNTSTYDNEDFLYDYEALLHLFKGKDNKKLIDKAFNASFQQTPESKIFNITRLLAKGNAFEWSNILANILGYAYIIDYGNSIVHKNEPAQAVVLYTKETSNKFELLYTFDAHSNAGNEFEKFLEYRILDLVNKGDKSIIPSLEPTNDVLAKFIIDFAKQGDSKAILKLDLNDDEMLSALIDLAKKGNKTAISRIENSTNELGYFKTELMPIMLELANHGNHKIISLICDNLYGQKNIKPFILQWAKNGNVDAIHALSPRSPEEKQILLELARKGNVYAISILENSNIVI